MLRDTCDTHIDHVHATDHLWKKLDTLASCNCTEDSLLHEFLGVALSLTVIMLQANFLLWEFFGLLPSLDKVVAVGCKEIFRVNNNLVLSSIPNLK